MRKETEEAIINSWMNEIRLTNVMYSKIETGSGAQIQPGSMYDFAIIDEENELLMNIGIFMMNDKSDFHSFFNFLAIEGKKLYDDYDKFILPELKSYIRDIKLNRLGI